MTRASFANSTDSLPRGQFTATGATPVALTNPYFKPGCFVIFGLKTVGGTVGNTPTIKTITNGSATVAATASDTSVYTYEILNISGV